jgi:hypothetical protein
MQLYNVHDVFGADIGQGAMSCWLPIGLTAGELPVSAVHAVTNVTQNRFDV